MSVIHPSPRLSSSKMGQMKLEKSFVRLHLEKMTFQKSVCIRRTPARLQPSIKMPEPKRTYRTRSDILDS
jgi:hypothetical protein